jgi:hypothetical protein
MQCSEREFDPVLQQHRDIAKETNAQLTETSKLRTHVAKAKVHAAF